MHTNYRGHSSKVESEELTQRDLMKAINRGWRYFWRKRGIDPDSKKGGFGSFYFGGAKNINEHKTERSISRISKATEQT